VLLIVNTGRATRPCTSGAGCHFDTDNHAPKERVHYVFWHQTKACAAGTVRQIFVAFVNKILHEKYIYTIISIKNVLIVRRRINMASMAPDPSSLIGRTTCVLLASALGGTKQNIEE